MSTEKSLKIIREIHNEVSLLYNKMSDSYEEAYPHLVISQDKDSESLYSQALDLLDEVQGLLFEIIEEDKDDED